MNGRSSLSNGPREIWHSVYLCCTVKFARKARKERVLSYLVLLDKPFIDIVWSRLGPRTSRAQANRHRILSYGRPWRNEAKPNVPQGAFLSRGPINRITGAVYSGEGNRGVVEGAQPGECEESCHEYVAVEYQHESRLTKFQYVVTYTANMYVLSEH